MRPKQVRGLIYGAVMLFVGLVMLTRSLFITSSIDTILSTLDTAAPYYQFDDADLAYKILQQLDHYKEIPEQWEKRFNLKGSYLGVIKDEAYCEKSRKYFTANAPEVFLRKNVLCTHNSSDLIRSTVISEIGNAISPELSIELKGQRVHKLSRPFKPNINFYFTRIQKAFHYKYVPGMNWACNHQVYSHIYGVEEMWEKSTFAINYQTYMLQYSNKSQCVQEFAPASYILTNETQCKKFFEYLETKEYKEEKAKLKYVFFKKIAVGAHQGKGVFVMNEIEELTLRFTYEFGKSCGKMDFNYQMQKYVPNVMTLDGFKFDFRIYMFIASVNPLIAYYHDGFLKLSLQKYNREADDLGIHLANTHVAEKIFEEARVSGWNGMNETEARAFQTWTYQRLQEYLLKHGLITDKNWIENSLKPQMKKAMIHILRMTSHGFWKKSNFCSLQGLDFVLDENLKLWFIETNPTPMLTATTAVREKLLVDMLKGYFEINFAYLRSRMKRVIQYVNRLGKTVPSSHVLGDTVILSNMAKNQEEFDELNKNYLEPEFKLSRSQLHGFELIVDENLEGNARYAGLLPSTCYAM
jgi:tubulin polyglutamylase TTLL1